MKAQPAALIEHLKAGLRQAADPSRAPGMQSYMKSTMPFYGVPTPVRRRLTMAAVLAHPMQSTPDLIEAITVLWRGAQAREERYVAIDLPMTGRVHRRLVDTTLCPTIEMMIVTGAWWDLVDALSGGVLADLLMRDKAVVEPLLRRWAVADSMWLRRAAMLCQRKFKGEHFDAALLYETILPSLAPGRFHDEFFIRKGIGWALRERAYHAPDEVRAFCREHADRLAPLTVREALRAIDRPHDSPIHRGD